MARFQALRGMRDILPPEIAKWHLAESRAREVVSRYGYAEIRTPILEAYELFARGVGESSDIVHKEMYVLERERERLALRPENTAPVGSAPGDVSPFGAYDLAGNVDEWCAYRYAPEYRPQNIHSAAERVLRGGCWVVGLDMARAARRGRRR